MQTSPNAASRQDPHIRGQLIALLAQREVVSRKELLKLLPVNRDVLLKELDQLLAQGEVQVLRPVLSRTAPPEQNTTDDSAEFFRLIRPIAPDIRQQQDLLRTMAPEAPPRGLAWLALMDQAM